MSYLRLFLGLKRRQAAGTARTFGKHSRLKVLVLATFAVGFWVGMYWLVRGAVRFVDDTVTVDISRQIDGALFPLAFFSLMLMLAFSNGIIGYTALFRNKETAWLMTHPVPPAAITVYKMGESLVFSSWAFFFIGAPALLGYGVERDVHWLYYPVTVTVFASFALLPGAIGNGVALCLVRFLPRRGRQAAIAGIAAVVVGGGGLVHWQLRQVTKAHNVFSEVGIAELFGKLEFLQNPLLPSWWASRAVLLSGQGWTFAGDVVLYTCALTSSGLLLLYLVTWLAHHHLEPAFDRAAGAPAKSRKAGRRRIRAAIDRVLFFLPVRTKLFLEKDLRTFVRDPVQWSQFLLLFGLLAFYVLNLRTFKYEQRPAFYRTLVAFLNLAATSLTMTTFASRFVFPLLSLEGKRFWILGIAPVPRRQILIGKFWFSLGFLLLVSQSLTAVSCYMLRLPLALSAIHCLTMVAISVGISGLSVGLGALYPNFQEDNPSKIVAGFGGTLNLVLSLLFILVVILVEAIPAHWYFVASENGVAIGVHWLIASVVLAQVIGAIVCVIPMRLGMRAFERLEF